MIIRPRVLLLLGYFDWFSGYQEAALAAWLPRHAATEIIASDRVSPIFSDANLAVLGTPRRYESGTRMENGVKVTRFAASERRGMVWSSDVRKYIESQKYDLIIQAWPGQLMPVAGTFARSHAIRAVLYGDNSAMWSQLPPAQRLLKGAVFAISKGLMYILVNLRADLVYGTTPNTLSRLKLFSGGKKMHLIPLVFDPAKFYFDETLRNSRRRQLGYTESDTVIIAAGKFQQKKRLDLLVTAFSQLAPEDSNLRLILVGADDSLESRRLRERISSDSVLSTLVTVLGFVNPTELNALFNASDVGVWPRMPAITIQQAMATGLIPVIPRNSWVGHLIHDGMGEYFEASDACAENRLVDALQRAVAPQSTSRHERAKHSEWLGADNVATQIVTDAGLVAIGRKRDNHGHPAVQYKVEHD